MGKKKKKIEFEEFIRLGNQLKDAQRIINEILTVSAVKFPKPTKRYLVKSLLYLGGFKSQAHEELWKVYAHDFRCATIGDDIFYGEHLRVTLSGKISHIKNNSMSSGSND